MSGVLSQVETNWVQPNWSSVESPPNDDGDIWLFSTQRGVFKGYYDAHDSKRWIMYSAYGMTMGVDDVTHWMHMAGKPRGPATEVACKFCGKETIINKAHWHDTSWVGECCWDERLAITG